MRIVIWLLVGGLGSLFGALVTYAGLVRLGWRRHGASPTDLSFLHLDWIFQPKLPYWSAHMQNLATVLVGILLVFIPVIVLLFRFFRNAK